MLVHLYLLKLWILVHERHDRREGADSRPVLPHVFTLSTDHLFIRYGFPLPLYTLWYEL